MDDEREEEPTDEYEVACNIVSCQEIVLSMNEAKRRWLPANGSYFNEFLSLHEVVRSWNVVDINNENYSTRVANYTWENMNTFDHQTVDAASEQLVQSGRIHLDKVFHLICQLVRSAISNRHAIDVLEQIDDDIVRAATTLFKIILRYHGERRPHPQKSISQEEFRKIEEYVQMIIEEKDYLQAHKSKHRADQSALHCIESRRTTMCQSLTTKTCSSQTSLTSLSSDFTYFAEGSLKDRLTSLKNESNSVKSSQASVDIPLMLNQTEGGKHEFNKLNCYYQTNKTHGSKVPDLPSNIDLTQLSSDDTVREKKELNNVSLNISEIMQLLPFLSPSNQIITKVRPVENDIDSEKAYDKKRIFYNFAGLLDADSIQPPFSRDSLDHYIKHLKHNADELPNNFLDKNIMGKDSSTFVPSMFSKIPQKKFPFTNPDGDNPCMLMCEKVTANDRDLSKYKTQKTTPTNENRNNIADVSVGTSSTCLCRENPNSDFFPTDNSGSIESLSGSYSLARDDQQGPISSLESTSDSFLEASGRSDTLQSCSLQIMEDNKIPPNTSDESLGYSDADEWSDRLSSREKSLEYFPCFSRGSSSGGNQNSLSERCTIRNSGVLHEDKLETSEILNPGKTLRSAKKIEDFYSNNFFIGITIILLFISVVPISKLRGALMSITKKCS